MPTIDERIGVVEIKVEHLNEKVDNIKQDVKETKDNVKENHEIIMKKLDDMEEKYEVNRDAYYEKLDRRKEAEDEAHAKLNRKIDNLEQFKMKWVYIVTGAAIVIGWVSAHGDNLIKMIAGK